MKDLRKRKDSFLDKYDQIVNLSREELEYIRNKYNWHLRLATGLIILTIFLIGLFLTNRLSGYEEILDKKFDEILKLTQDKQDSLNRYFTIETKKSIESIVKKNFSEKEILKTIKSVANVKVDSFSNVYLDKLVENKITPKLNDVFDKLGDADDKIQLIEFYFSKVAALNDDRLSFDKLIEISQNKNNKYNALAKQTIASIIEKYSKPFIPRKHLIFMTTENDNVFNWSFKKVYDSFFLYPKEERIALLKNVIEIKRFTYDERVKLALLAVKNDENLSVVKVASEFLINTFNLQYKPLEIREIISSLAKHGYK